MTRSMFFLVTEEIFNEGTDDEFVGYTIGTKQVPKSRIIKEVATHNSKAIILIIAQNDKEYDWGTAQDEYLSNQYQKMLLDSQFGLLDDRIAKKCYDVRYFDPTDEEFKRTSVYDWELNGFPGQGTHEYFKNVKVLGVEIE